MLPMKIILHPTDFSDDSAYPFQVACSLAGHYQARLVLLHVMAPSAAAFGGAVPSPLEPVETQEAFKWRFQWPQPPDKNIVVEHRVAEGDAAEEVLRMCTRLGCDVVVMGTRGRSGVGRILTGSVAEEVLRKAPCPVLTVKTPESFSPPESTFHSPPAEIVDVRPLGTVTLAASRTRRLVLTDELEISRLIVHEGENLSGNLSKGTSVFQCLEGRVTFTACGKTRGLEAGDLIYLPGSEPYVIKAIEDASLLFITFTASPPSAAPRSPEARDYAPPG
jgi:nucleotide-binding universal stress UspA family protein/quercetin dioxygenase-like cupin family protein